MPKTPTLPTSAFPELQIKTITRKTNQNLDKPRQRHQHSHTNKRADLTAPKKPKTDPFQMKKKKRTRRTWQERRPNSFAGNNESSRPIESRLRSCRRRRRRRGAMAGCAGKTAEGARWFWNNLGWSKRGQNGKFIN